VKPSTKYGVNYLCHQIVVNCQRTFSSSNAEIERAKSELEKEDKKALRSCLAFKAESSSTTTTVSFSAHASCEASKKKEEDKFHYRSF